MRILIETSGGGGVVLVVVAALLAGGHGGGLDAAAAAVLITLAVVVALALGGLVALLVYRARRGLGQWEPGRPKVVQLRKNAAQSCPPGGEITHPDYAAERPALETPAVRLHPEQLAELAAILRRHEETP